MRVLMIDDHVMFLQGLKNLLAVLSPNLTVDTADNLSFALQLLRSASYELVLLDWHLPDVPGSEAMQRLRNAGFLGRIVVLSGETSTGLIRSTVDEGAAGFIPKTFSSEMMISAIGQVLEGQIFLPLEASAGSRGAVLDAEKVENDRRFAGLTARQIDAYLGAAQGLPNKLIAKKMGVAESTVKSHLSAVYAVLGVRNRTEAAYQASRDGTRIV